MNGSTTKGSMHQGTPKAAQRQRASLAARTAADPDVGDLSACNDAIMPDRELSEALQTYVWGTAGLPWPSERPDALQADQQRFLPMLREIVAVAFSVDPFAGTLNEAAGRAEAALRAQYPDLTEDAIRAVGNLFAYQWK
jgi:hypothetical protein